MWGRSTVWPHSPVRLVSSLPKTGELRPLRHTPTTVGCRERSLYVDKVSSMPARAKHCHQCLYSLSAPGPGEVRSTAGVREVREELARLLADDQDGTAEFHVPSDSVNSTARGSPKITVRPFLPGDVHFQFSSKQYSAIPADPNLGYPQVDGLTIHQVPHLYVALARMLSRHAYQEDNSL